MSNAASAAQRQTSGCAAVVTEAVNVAMGRRSWCAQTFAGWQAVNCRVWA